jgi:methylmalonyl-CoA mutase
MVLARPPRHRNSSDESRGNIFEELLKTVRTCSLGQISNALYEVGGQYRRSM